MKVIKTNHGSTIDRDSDLTKIFTEINNSLVNLQSSLSTWVNIDDRMCGNKTVVEEAKETYKKEVDFLRERINEYLDFQENFEKCLTNKI